MEHNFLPIARNSTLIQNSWICYSLIYWSIRTIQSFTNSYYNYYYYLLIENFSRQRQLMGFHWTLSRCNSLQISRTLLSIMADLNNVVLWMVSTHSVISKSSSLFIHLSVTVPRAPITIGKSVIFMFHNFFDSLARSSNFPTFLYLKILLSGQPEQQSPQFCKFYCFCWLL